MTTELEEVHARYVERSEGFGGWDYRGWDEVVKIYASQGPRPRTRDLEYDRMSMEGNQARRTYALTHSWAIPTEEAIQFIKGYAPHGLVDMGAGSGYWAHLLHDAGVAVRAFDTAPGNNTWTEVEQSWFLVEVGSPATLAFLPGIETLLLVWPPYSDSMAAESLRFFQGHTVIYVGEQGGGCTGDEIFHDMLENEWTEVDNLGIPQWPGLHDSIAVYRRGLIRASVRRGPVR